MSQIINKIIFKYIVFLVLSFAGSIVMMLSIHFYFQDLSSKLDSKTTNTQAKINIGRYVYDEVLELHTSLLELSATTRSKSARTTKLEEIRKRIFEVQKHIAILNNGGVFEKRLTTPHQNLIAIPYFQTDGNTLNVDFTPLFESFDTIARLLNLRDLHMETLDPKLNALIAETRNFNAKSFLLFASIQTSINDMLNAEHQNLQELNAQNASTQTWYNLLETLTLLLSIMLVAGVIYKILQQIINLYKELENQLYVDGLTKLRSRSRLLKDIKDAQNPSVILIDINSFHSINELYGVDVGNEVLVNFALLLRDFAKNKDFKIYRISGDEFVFFKDVPRTDMHACITLLETLFDTLKNSRIFITSLQETLYVDITAGASFNKENPLGTADIALNRAKMLHQPYVIFHNELDSIKEIAYGALWKKKIINGLLADAFLPFFQPIVDREQKIVKYEALMRFRQENGKISYIAPFEFLDIATKTRHYNEISQMTLFKSLHVSAEHDVDISLNLNYQDILNKPLHELLKQYICEKKMAHHVIFEIVESQNIQDYTLVNDFIAEFEALGVRFAIDDFGTGFSNFSHICELSPHFIKIDGSLIKNLDTDKKSYELVKAIVFFSKELGIKTIAEFVHSKEVFDVTYDLGIDFFQGYYFGAPKAQI